LLWADLLDIGMIYLSLQNSSTVTTLASLETGKAHRLLPTGCSAKSSSNVEWAWVGQIYHLNHQLCWGSRKCENLGRWRRIGPYNPAPTYRLSSSGAIYVSHSLCLRWPSFVRHCRAPTLCLCQCRRRFPPVDRQPLPSHSTFWHACCVNIAGLSVTGHSLAPTVSGLEHRVCKHHSCGAVGFLRESY
jgi:hypothetical protein